MIDNFEPPRNVELDSLDNENHNWNLVETSELFFDDELINFIVQMVNAFAFETNAVGLVPIDSSDIHCFLGMLMLMGMSNYPPTKCFGRNHQMSRNNWSNQLCLEANFVISLNSAKYSFL